MRSRRGCWTGSAAACWVAWGGWHVDEIAFAGQLHPDRVAAVAVRATASQVRTLARRALAALDAEALRAQRERARAERDVDLVPGRPGIRWLGAPLNEAEAAAIYDRLDRTARDLAQDPAESRTVGQLRADVFRDLLLSTGGLEGALAGVRAAVQLRITVDQTGAATCDRVGAITPAVIAEPPRSRGRDRWTGAGQPGDFRVLPGPSP